MNKVVVTGIGVVSPLGKGRQAFVQGLQEGRSGIRRIQAFDPSALPVQIAGEVPEEELPEILRPGCSQRFACHAPLQPGGRGGVL